jgi:hypothetical protein
VSAGRRSQLAEPLIPVVHIVLYGMSSRSVVQQEFLPKADHGWCKPMAHGLHCWFTRDSSATLLYAASRLNHMTLVIISSPVDEACMEIMCLMRRLGATLKLSCLHPRTEIPCTTRAVHTLSTMSEPTQSIWRQGSQMKQSRSLRLVSDDHWCPEQE